jgi:glyceraldehyde 3-phosphate dehydrogenase
MVIKVGINGFGRIGRNVFRILSGRDDIEVVAINDLTSPEVLAHLLKYDSVLRSFGKSVEVGDGALIVDGVRVQITQERDPANLGWSKSGADYVVESTGVFTNRASLEKHLQAGAKKVVLTVPPKDAIDALVVLGVNDEMLKPEHKLVSNASCTTNCLAPLAKALDSAFGIEKGFMTTVHAYTNDQRLSDLPHSDLRRSRAAAQNIIPTSTGAARAVGQVLPHLNGKLDGMAMRVPVIDGSAVDLTVDFAKEVTAEDINAAVKKAAAEIPTILEYCEDPIVSSDVLMNPHSSVFDSLATQVLGGKGTFAKVIAWYDNEWGYSNRVVDLLVKIAT